MGKLQFYYNDTHNINMIIQISLAKPLLDIKDSDKMLCILYRQVAQILYSSQQT